MYNLAREYEKRLRVEANGGTRPEMKLGNKWGNVFLNQLRQPEAVSCAFRPDPPPTVTPPPAQAPSCAASGGAWGVGRMHVRRSDRACLRAQPRLPAGPGARRF